MAFLTVLFYWTAGDYNIISSALPEEKRLILDGVHTHYKSSIERGFNKRREEKEYIDDEEGIQSSYRLGSSGCDRSRRRGEDRGGFIPRGPLLR